MTKLSFLLLVPYLFVVVSLASPQQKLNIHPPPSLENSDSTRGDTSPTMQRQIDLVELQREADDLARTAQTIPSDMANVRKGTLPKDLILKLKQIEKLSKHLRSQVSQ